MSAHRKCSLLLGLILASFPALPVAAGGTATNFAVVDASGTEEASAAICQLVILVNSIIIVEAEDGLGLATRLAPEPVVVDVPSEENVRSTYAECEVAIRKIRILEEAGDGFSAYRGNYVTGPPGLHPDGNSPITNNLIVRLSGSPASIAVCQLVVVVNSVILGGGAAGFDTGSTPGVLRIENSFHTGDTSKSSCSVDVGDVGVD